MKAAQDFLLWHKGIRWDMVRFQAWPSGLRTWGCHSCRAGSSYCSPRNFIDHGVARKERRKEGRKKGGREREREKKRRKKKNNLKEKKAPISVKEMSFAALS